MKTGLIFDLDGTLLDTLEDLLDAKEHPERHGNLIVRVGGYSSQFILLDPETQDEIISRYTA